EGHLLRLLRRERRGAPQAGAVGDQGLRRLRGVAGPGTLRRAVRRRSAHVEVVLLNQQRRRRVPAARLRRVIEDAGRALRVTGEVALVLTSDAPVRRLTPRYRHEPNPTD